MKHQSIFPQGIASGGGMSKREYFAIKMLQSMVAVEPKGNKPAESQKAIVALALQFADALLEALDGKD
jgi:hypothetical protein